MPSITRETKALPLLAAYPFAAAHGLEAEAERIRGMSVGSSVRRGHFVHLFRQAGLLEAFIAEHWTLGKTKTGAAKLRYYDHLRQRSSLSSGEPEPPDDDPSDEEEVAAQSFALEADLRDYLASNLSALEPGLRLYEADGRKGWSTRSTTDSLIFWRSTATGNSS